MLPVSSSDTSNLENSSPSSNNLNAILNEEKARFVKFEKSLKDVICKLENDIQTLNAEKDSLQKQIANHGPDSEKKYQRFQELFKTMFGQYKEAIYLITGYKIEKVGDNQLYRIRPMFAEEAEDQMLFQISESYLYLFFIFTNIAPNVNYLKLRLLIN